MMTTVTSELLDSRLETIETRIDGRILSLESKIDAKFSSVDAKFAEIRSDIQKSSDILRVEMHKNTADMIKWMIATAAALGVAMITVMSFALNNARPKATAQQVTEPVTYLSQAAQPLPAATPQQTPSMQ
ncbi:hypothetical protein QN363_07015 [Undibacterium sp. CCC2.1]|uniref:hypothetical protein n=2 Tax=Undibacterium TaxID=401469 RepID=UPI002B22A727|nr:MULTISPECIES: hypothetical protein [unclassified Undibacterium]MEB0138771.1 hypothetical protein [Undibacterium sp. CCC2.1]MEB0170753.1 hypothetical protein [Undibacterium sp. CCC1.1]MEB0174642.1 hypothetical protein [Undibacterium sp. CCC3.4]MEB0213839.1 hypothetical protein [Undibacterium sp. 5I2]